MSAKSPASPPPSLNSMLPLFAISRCLELRRQAIQTIEDAFRLLSSRGRCRRCSRDSPSFVAILTAPCRISAPGMSSTENTSPPMAEQGIPANTQSPPDRNKKKRIRNWTADDRAAHRVFERSRREAFKERLTTLASFIPSLRSTDPNRLSKHVVIDQSVALHKAEQQRIVASDQKLHRLAAERDELLSELNTWRLNAGLEVHQARVVADEPEAAPMPMMGEIDAAMLRSSISSIGMGEEQGATGSGPIYLEEQSSFTPTEHELPPEAVLVPAAETELPPASTSTGTGIPWMPAEMNFSIPNSIPLDGEFHADALDKSPSYTHLPMTYGMATNNLDGEALHFNTAMMHMADPSSYHNDTYIYNG